MTDVTLATPRLTLREFSAEDFAAVDAYGSDPQVTRWTVFGPNSERDTRGFLQQARVSRAERPRRNFDLAVTLSGDGRLIGGCGLRRTDVVGEAFIGYVLRRDAWGRGYATEAARALLAFGFERLGLRRIFADCHPANMASWRVMEKLGMRREGHFREEKLVKGEWWDRYVYAMLAPEWRAARPPNPDDTMSVP
jgi:RimJ/RimL family protein N-acetyltransferase